MSGSWVGGNKVMWAGMAPASGARSAGLVFGLFLCAVGIVSLLEARLGLSPWDVLHQGLAKHTPLTFGAANIVVGIAVLLLAWALGGPPGKVEG